VSLCVDLDALPLEGLSISMKKDTGAGFYLAKASDSEDKISIVYIKPFFFAQKKKRSKTL
jgi:hypothetical protein